MILSLNFRQGLISLILLFLTACSFQASRPAPVENINLGSSSINSYSKGSIQSKVYQVRQGDTLYSIAWGADQDHLNIAKWNRLAEPYIIHPGQKLTLNTPPKKKKNTVNQPTTKIIQKNDNFDSDKKKVVKENQYGYSVTNAQQIVNSGSIHSVKLLPDKVNWFWPIKGKLLDTFSEFEQGKKGIKISGKLGATIKAAAAGRVVYAGDALRGYGNLVIIKHNNDYLSAYAHTNKILVKEKQYVKAGQAIATMGRSDADKVMLHFEIRYHGKSVNPLNYLPKQQ